MTDTPSNPDPAPEADDPKLAELNELNMKIRTMWGELAKLRFRRRSLIATQPFNWEKDARETLDFEQPPKPHTRWSFCGVDTLTLLVSPERGEEPRIVKPAPNIAGVSWARTDNYATGEYMGTILAAVIEESLWPTIPVELGGLVFQAVDEYGVDAWMVIRRVKVVGRGGGISIDDITTEDNYTFTAEAVVGWLKGRAYRQVQGEYLFSKEAIEALTGDSVNEYKPRVVFRMS